MPARVASDPPSATSRAQRRKPLVLADEALLLGGDEPFDRLVRAGGALGRFRDALRRVRDPFVDIGDLCGKLLQRRIIGRGSCGRRRQGAVIGRLRPCRRAPRGFLDGLKPLFDRQRGHSRGRPPAPRHCAARRERQAPPIAPEARRSSGPRSARQAFATPRRRARGRRRRRRRGAPPRRAPDRCARAGPAFRPAGSGTSPGGAASGSSAGSAGASCDALSASAGPASASLGGASSTTVASRSIVGGSREGSLREG